MTDTVTEVADETTGEEQTSEEGQPDDAQTYPAEVVRKLLDENAKYRTRCRDAEARADELAHALWTLRVEATGKVQNAAEIPYNADLLNDPDAISQAVEAAISERPYIQKRKVSGSIGQGERGQKAAVPQDFSALLRG